MEQGAKRWLKRTRSRLRSGGGADEVMSYAEQMRLEALMEYQRKLSEPVLLNNEVLISFASRMAAEMDFRPYKTMTTMYSKTFKADEFLLWAIRQEEVRDQTDALFLGNELVSRGVFLPVTYGAADSLYWTPTIKPGNQTHRLVARTKPQIVAAVLGRDLKVLIEEGGTIAGLGPNSPTASDSATPTNDGQTAVRRTASDPPPATANGHGNTNGHHDPHQTRTTANGHRDPPRVERRGILKRSATYGHGAERGFAAALSVKEFARGWARRRAEAKRARVKRWQRRARDFRASVRAATAPVRLYLGSTLGPHALFAVTFPLLVLHLWHTTMYAVIAALWCVRHLANVDARQRRWVEQKTRAEELRRFQGKRGYAKLHPDGSECADWWSEVLRSFWDGWIEFWLNRLLTRILTNVLDRVRPSYLEKLEITTFKLGDAAPRINSSRCWRGNEGETILEWDLVWHTENMQITLSAKVGGAKFAVPVPLRVYVSKLRIAGKFRMGLFWTRRKGGPYLQKLRISFVGMPEHSVSIKPMTSSFVDIRDLPGVDSLIENALNNLFTNVLVEPNCVNWDVEKWWINRPGAREPGALGLNTDNPGEITEAELLAEAERIQGKKGSSLTSIMGLGSSKHPTMTVAMTVHLAEIESKEGAKPCSFYVRCKRGAKKHTTEAAKAAPVETMVTAHPSGGSEHGGSQGDGSNFGSFGAGDELGLDSLANLQSPGGSFAQTQSRPGHRRGTSSFSQFGSSFSIQSSTGETTHVMEKKWVCRPVWEEFVRLDAYDKQVDQSVELKVSCDDGSSVVGSKTTVGRAMIESVLDYADGALHTVQLPILHHRTGEEVGLLHLRLKCTPILPDLIAAAKDRNPHASLLRNPKTYSKQFAMSASDYMAAKAAGMASAVSGLMPSVPVPKKYVDSAAKTMTKTAISAINAPAKQGRWAVRSVYKGCKKLVYGKAKYKEMKKVKLERALREAQEAAKYAEAWQQSAAAAAGKNRWRRSSSRDRRPDTPSKMSDIAESPSGSEGTLARQDSDASTASGQRVRPVSFAEAPAEAEAAATPSTPRA